MDTDTNKVRAIVQAFYKLNKQVFIRDVNDNLYFCDILHPPADDFVIVRCFGPDQRKGEVFQILYAMIDRIEEYKHLKPALEVGE